MVTKLTILIAPWRIDPSYIDAVRFNVTVESNGEIYQYNDIVTKDGVGWIVPIFHQLMQVAKAKLTKIMLDEEQKNVTSR